MVSHCGQPNTAQYGDCIICGRNYEHIKETAALSYLEATTYRGETYGARLRRREAYLAGMDQGTLLFVPGECCRLPPVTAIITRFYWREIIQAPSRSTPYLKRRDTQSVQLPQSLCSQIWKLLCYDM